MNVLVYAGPGASGDFVKFTIDALKQLLTPYYAVFPVDAKTIVSEPWPAKTSMLVMPGGADLPYCKLLNGEGNKVITNYVRKGGRYLGLCAGAYYASGRCEFEVGDLSMEVSGPRELQFFPGITRGTAFKGFEYDSDVGAKIVDLEVNGLPAYPDSHVSNYYNGGCVFVNTSAYSNVEVLASYQDQMEVEDDDNRKAAVVFSKIGLGCALLTGTHPEISAAHLKYEKDHFRESLASNLELQEEKRSQFFRHCLLKMGLKVGDQSRSLAVPKLTPLLLGAPSAAQVQDVLTKLRPAISDENVITGTSDRFQVHSTYGEALEQCSKQNLLENPDELLKHLVVFDGHQSANFDIVHFFNFLKSTELGSVILYGDVVTSTSSLLDKNGNLLKYLPSGLVAVGGQQVSGRGRGGNVWVNPVGVLASSVLIKFASSPVEITNVVFIQYLVSISWIDAIKGYDSGYSEVPVKIKWPNDIYMLKPDLIGKNKEQDLDSYVKVGGILVNTNILDGVLNLVVGCGINVANAAPTTALNMAIEKLNTGLEFFSQERLLATYLTKLEANLSQFRSCGFSPLMEKYKSYWLHNDQVVIVDGDHGKIRGKIKGITENYGLLIVNELGLGDRETSTQYELQPDGNSFEMFSGLISKRRNHS